VPPGKTALRCITRLRSSTTPPGSATLAASATLAGPTTPPGSTVLPGWVVPVAECTPALSAGAAAVRDGRPAAARRAVLGHRLDDDLAAELREAVVRLGGRVIVRSSSPLEDDPRWSGAFSSVAEVGPDDAVPAVRSCWASAFAPDPPGRLGACGLPPEALELGVLLQPEIRPVAGGVARMSHAAHAPGTEVAVEGAPGHPGALLSGWAEGASARLPLLACPRGTGWLPGRADEDGLARLIGPELVAAVATLAGRAWRLLGDDVIEWAATDGGVWLLQSRRSAATPGRAGPTGDRADWAGAGQAAGPVGAGLPMERAWMPLLAATVLGRGEHVPGRPGAPGTAAGRLLAGTPSCLSTSRCQPWRRCCSPRVASSPARGRRAHTWPRLPGASGCRWCLAAARSG
jgi:hypothetical protein